MMSPASSSRRDQILTKGHIGEDLFWVSAELLAGTVKALTYTVYTSYQLFYG